MGYIKLQFCNALFSWYCKRFNVVLYSPVGKQKLPVSSVLFSNLSHCVTSTHTLLMIVSHFLYMHIVLLIKISNLSQLAEKD